ncbi:MAG: PhnD/SsuA/transferrin family substrate-binding protein [Candidatus Wallbacteria bacterium]|nr:PhnD/SsuA/transferrin family substrate-binding protein [Candidatus Wallbacteria bacterium]
MTASLLAIAAFAAGTAIPRRPAPLLVDLAKRVAPSSVAIPHASAERAVPALRVAFATMISPRETRSVYGRLAGYLAVRTGRRAEIVQRGSYAEVNRLLDGDLLSLAFICSGAYPEAHDVYGARPLASPVVGGSRTYRSCVLVPREHPARSVRDLAGLRLALVDRESLTGRLYLLSRFLELGIPENDAMRQVSWTHSHDRSIRLVARGVVDAAAVDSLVWLHLAGDHPELTRTVRVLEYSGDFPAPPLVIPRNCDPALETRLRQALLAMHQDDAGRPILASLGIDRFEPVFNYDFDAVRRLQRRVLDEAPLVTRGVR